jgi:lipopolysaccharide biosynthesis glycosyltransferase
MALHLLRDYEETHTDGSNQFIYSRFLVPYMMGFKGWAVFCDGDMVVKDDIAKLWALRSDEYGAMVVKHDYQSKHRTKYVGTSMETINPNYPRKNWSSVILWNCEHPANLILTPEYVRAHPGSVLHRFSHLLESELGELPKEWNWLVGEYPENPDAKLIHYTLGIPAIEAYKDCEHAREWREAMKAATEVQT